MTSALNEYLPDAVSAPRETLRELMEEKALSEAELAKRMELPSLAVAELLSDTFDTPITAALAAKLSNAVGLSAQFWLNREAAYRESLAAHPGNKARQAN
jgi:HTH-type transcriptional regulator / antitoxin HigA